MSENTPSSQAEQQAHQQAETEGGSMRALGRWFGRMRREFLGGLHGGEPPAVTREQAETQREGRTVVVRRTMIEEIRVHESAADDR